MADSSYDADGNLSSIRDERLANGIVNLTLTSNTYSRLGLPDADGDLPRPRERRVIDMLLESNYALDASGRPLVETHTTDLQADGRSTRCRRPRTPTT